MQPTVTPEDRIVHALQFLSCTIKYVPATLHTDRLESLTRIRDIFLPPPINHTQPDPRENPPEAPRVLTQRLTPPIASTVPSAYARPTSKGGYTSCTTRPTTKDSHREPIHPRPTSSPPHALTHHPTHASTIPTNAVPAHFSPHQGTHNRHQCHVFYITL